MISAVQPAYPAEALTAAIEGTVRLNISVDERGRVTHVEVLVSSGNPSLDAAAVQGAQGWRFTPALRQGRPVPSEVRRKVVFRLD